MIGMKVEDNVDGATNFIFWNSIVLILEENDLLSMRRFQNRTLKKTSLVGGRVMPEQEESW